MLNIISYDVNRHTNIHGHKNTVMDNILVHNVVPCCVVTIEDSELDRVWL